MATPKKFADLVAKMSPESQARIRQKAEELRAEMARTPRRKIRDPGPNGGADSPRG